MDERIEEITPSEQTAVDDSGETAQDTAHASEEENGILEQTEKVDYEALAREDLAELKAEFPELSALNSLAKIKNPMRYGALRELGLSVREAYLATNERPLPRPDNRAHLHSAVPRGRTGSPSELSAADLKSARELFGNLSDREIERLYKKVNS